MPSSKLSVTAMALALLGTVWASQLGAQAVLLSRLVSLRVDTLEAPLTCGVIDARPHTQHEFDLGSATRALAGTSLTLTLVDDNSSRCTLRVDFYGVYKGDADWTARFRGMLLTVQGHVGAQRDLVGAEVPLGRRRPDNQRADRAAGVLLQQLRDQLAKAALARQREAPLQLEAELLVEGDSASLVSGASSWAQHLAGALSEIVGADVTSETRVVDLEDATTEVRLNARARVRRYQLSWQQSPRTKKRLLVRAIIEASITSGS